MNAMIKKYTSRRRFFEVAPGNRFITVYVDGRISGFIFNNDRTILIDGEEVIQSEFFK